MTTISDNRTDIFERNVFRLILLSTGP